MKRGFWIVVFFLTSCTAQTVAPPTPTLLTIPVFVPLPTHTITPTPIPTFTPEPTFTPFPTLTLAPYEQYSIDYLRSRSYGGGVFEVVETLSEHSKFTTYTIRYPSDGLFIYGVMNVPNTDGFHPVVISVHGYYKPKTYQILDTDFTIEDELADHGYVTIHPAMRNYSPSDSGDDLFRVGDTIDILNLIALVKSQGGTGVLQKIDPNRMGLGGRSMGGGIVLRVLAVTNDIKAAYLYSPTSGDEALNVKFFHNFARDAQFNGEMDAPAEALEKMSPQNYYGNITASVLLAHGVNDRTIPDTWSEDTCKKLKAAGVDKKCFFYPGADHSFQGDHLKDFISEVISFFENHLAQ